MDMAATAKEIAERANQEATEFYFIISSGRTSSRGSVGVMVSSTDTCTIPDEALFHIKTNGQSNWALKCGSSIHDFSAHGSERQWTTEGFVTRFVPVKLQLKELKLTDCSDGLNRVVVTIGVRYRTVSILGHTCFDSDDFLLRHRNTICSSWSIPAVAVIWVFWPHATRNMCVKSNKEMRMTPVMNNPNEFKRTKRSLTGESNQITT